MHQNLIHTAHQQIVQQDNFEKGQRFEKFILSLFSDTYFQEKKWRKSEKFTPSFRSIDHQFPDIEIALFYSSRKKYQFAVECKWRKEFKDGKISWATTDQIHTYRKFQDQVRIPVFVAIGIGGEPDHPEKLFLTPLDNIHMHNELYETDLIPYKRKPTRKFYFDPRQLRLF